jgi:hypothetical protein
MPNTDMTKYRIKMFELIDRVSENYSGYFQDESDGNVINSEKLNYLISQGYVPYESYTLRTREEFSYAGRAYSQIGNPTNKRYSATNDGLTTGTIYTKYVNTDLVPKTELILENMFDSDNVLADINGSQCISPSFTSKRQSIEKKFIVNSSQISDEYDGDQYTIRIEQNSTNYREYIFSTNADGSVSLDSGTITGSPSWGNDQINLLNEITEDIKNAFSIDTKKILDYNEKLKIETLQRISSFEIPQVPISTTRQISGTKSITKRFGFLIYEDGVDPMQTLYGKSIANFDNCIEWGYVNPPTISPINKKHLNVTGYRTLFPLENPTSFYRRIEPLTGVDFYDSANWTDADAIGTYDNVANTITVVNSVASRVITAASAINSFFSNGDIVSIKYSYTTDGETISVGSNQFPACATVSDINAGGSLFDTTQGEMEVITTYVSPTPINLYIHFALATPSTTTVFSNIRIGKVIL